MTFDLNPIWLRRVATLLLAASLSVLIGAGSALAAGAPIAVDFDAALRGVRFDPAKADGNLDATGKANGLLDSDEMALVAQILSTPDLDLSASGGVRSGDVAAAYAQALASATADTQRLAKAYPTVGGVSTGYALLGQGSFKAFNAMTTSFGAPLRGDYSLALGLDRFLSADGDADGDGVSNRQEHAAHIKAGRAAYVKAALDPGTRDGAQLAAVSAAPPTTSKKVIGIVLYPGFEVLDVFGPVEMWANVPDFQVVLIAEKAGPVPSAQGVSVVAEYGFDTAPKLDIMMAPGGIGTTAQLENPVYLNFLRQQDKTTEFTTSVCTGSALLAKAGLLKGRRATSNKMFFSMATSQDSSVNWIKRARWVEDGKYVTSSGVSAGTDMALGLVAKIYGKDRASALARSLEYQWSDNADHDPFAIP